MTLDLFTIGHSTHTIEKFSSLLHTFGITAIADVRSSPYSRMNPQFNREALRVTLKKLGVAYVFLGRELGARAEDRSCYVAGKVQYDRLAKTELFQEGLARIQKGVESHQIAMMCAEKDPLTCHRTILVARHLFERGINVNHILANATLESHSDALTRLLAEVGTTEPELFRAREKLVEDAYFKRGDQIAYVEDEPAFEPKRSVGR